jgi:glycosyltransferase involved in cell wall biosynthesis
MTTIDIGIFAHNEEAGIGAMLRDLARQSVLRDDRFSVRVVVLANGCRDKTASAAREAVSAFPDPAMVEVLDLAEGGKSRTWNRFVHDVARPDADLLAFLDADIGLPQQDVIDRLAAFLNAHPGVDATSSQPVKDIDYHPVPLDKARLCRAADLGGRGQHGQFAHLDLRAALCDAGFRRAGLAGADRPAGRGRLHPPRAHYEPLRRSDPL